MRGDSLLDDVVHLLGADLKLEMTAFFADDRGVQRPVAVFARHGDEILDPIVEGLTVFVHYAEREITVLLFPRDDPNRGQVVYLIERNLLALEFEINAVEPLDAPLDPDEVHALIGQPLGDRALDLFEKSLG